MVQGNDIFGPTGTALTRAIGSIHFVRMAFSPSTLQWNLLREPWARNICTVPTELNIKLINSDLRTKVRSYNMHRPSRTFLRFPAVKTAAVNATSEPRFGLHTTLATARACSACRIIFFMIHYHESVSVTSNEINLKVTFDLVDRSPEKRRTGTPVCRSVSRRHGAASVAPSSAADTCSSYTVSGNPETVH